MKALLTNLAIIASLSSISMGANAAFQSFFGEDKQTDGRALGTISAQARADFLSHLTSGVGSYDFEDAQGNPPYSIQFPGSTNTLTANLSGNIALVDGRGFGRFPTSGKRFLFASSGQFNLNFSRPVSAFGFNGTDIGDFVTKRMTISLTDTQGQTQELTVPHSLNIGNKDYASLFWGFTDTTRQYISVSFHNHSGQTEDLFGFDDFVVGDANQISNVPLPATLALILPALFASTRRKKK